MHHSKTLLIILTLCLGLTGCLEKDGVVKIATDPRDANIYMNGELAGRSLSRPGEYLTLTLKQGQYKLVAIKPVNDATEYYAERTIVVAGNRVEIIDVKLEERATEAAREGRTAVNRIEEMGASRTEEAERLRLQAELEEEQRFKAQHDVRLELLLRGVEADLVSIPGGRFRMGSELGEDNEKPPHMVTVKPFRMMATVVTYEMWDACVDDGGCEFKPDDDGNGRGDLPVTRVSYDQINNQFIPWLNAKLHRSFRLPTEAEWEYAARAGTVSEYYWGNDVGKNYANCYNCGSQWDRRQVAPVKSFPPNAFGMYEMLGNVWEWTQDCWNDNYRGAPIDGSAWTAGNCDRRVLRGGSWGSVASWIRSSFRGRGISGLMGGDDGGFRLATSADE